MDSKHDLLWNVVIAVIMKSTVLVFMTNFVLKVDPFDRLLDLLVILDVPCRKQEETKKTSNRNYKSSDELAVSFERITNMKL